MLFRTKVPPSLSGVAKTTQELHADPSFAIELSIRLRVRLSGKPKQPLGGLRGGDRAAQRPGSCWCGNQLDPGAIAAEDVGNIVEAGLAKHARTH